MDSAYKFAKLCEPYHLAWLEEPIHSHNMNGIRRLKEMGVKIPIAFGESMRIYYEYETYIEKGVDHVQPSVGRMTEWMILSGSVIWPVKKELNSHPAEEFI